MLAWEYGRNLGHLSRLMTAARLLDDRGATLTWVLPQAYLLSPRLEGMRGDRIPTPMAARAVTPSAGRINSFADILSSFGFANSDWLFGALCGWIKILERVRPRSIVLDYAPVAQLASQIIGIPAFQITNGLDAPPDHCPAFGLHIRGPYMDRLNARNLSAVDEAISIAAKRLSTRNHIDSKAFFNHPIKIYDLYSRNRPIWSSI